MSLKRWVFRWRLKVRMFLCSRMSAGRVPGGRTSNSKSATGQLGVCEERPSAEHRKNAEVVHGSVMR